MLGKSTLITFLSTAFLLTLFSSGVLGAEGLPPVIQPQLNINISTVGTQWFEAYPPNDNPQILMMFRSPIIHKSVQPTLTVRRDKAQPEDDLKKYAHRWTKEMSRFGIKVLGTQFFSQGEQVGYAVDLTPEGSIKRQRQTLFLKNQDVVILTCTAHKEDFKSSLKDCNRIIENFSWNVSANQESVRGASSTPPTAPSQDALMTLQPEQKPSAPSAPNQKVSSETL